MQDGERQVTLRRTGDVQGIGRGLPRTPSGAHPDYAAMDVLLDVLTNEPSGRIYKALIESKKASPASGASRPRCTTPALPTSTPKYARAAPSTRPAP